MHAKKIFLTFDDGPGPKTQEIAERLNEMGIKATFFMLGINIQNMPGIVKRVSELGHEIGVHAYHHDYLPALNLRQTVYEIKITADLLKEITGKKPRVFRAAYGMLSPNALAVLERYGMKHIDWSLDTKDWEKAMQGRRLDPMEIVQKARPGDVILFHDGAVGRYAIHAGMRGQNVLDAMPRIVQGLRQKGCEFEPIEKQFQKGQRWKYKIRTKMKEARAKAQGIIGIYKKWRRKK